MKPLKIFLCHASNDKKEVKEIYKFLKKAGADPWLDSEDLLPGMNWDLEIRKALDDSHVIMLCLTKKSVDKEGYVQKEIRLALDRALEMPEGRIFLVPCKIEECEIPFSLQEYQWVNLFEEDGMQKLVKGLNAAADRVQAQPIAEDGSAPAPVKKSTPKKRTSKPAQPSTNITINGSVSGQIVIGDGNSVSNTEQDE